MDSSIRFDTVNLGLYKARGHRLELLKQLAFQSIKIVCILANSTDLQKIPCEQWHVISKNVWFFLFDFILYVPSTIFQLNRDGSSWVEPVLS